jgi:hypothetical protein
LEINDVFPRKIVTTRASKYANLVKAFFNNHISYERKLFKEELFAYHKDQKVSIGMFILNYMSLNS